MKTLAVTGITIGVLECTHAMKFLAQNVPFVKNYATAGRIGIDLASIAGGVLIARPQKGFWAVKAFGAGLAIEGFVDLLKAIIPSAN